MQERFSCGTGAALLRRRLLRDTERVKLHILSYNIHKGFAVGNQRFVLTELREAIRSLPLDLVFLQEVLGAHDEHARTIEGWPLASQFEYLADQVWPHYAYGKNAVYEAGHHGNAILSRFPILSYANYDISTNPLERRGILHVVIEIPETGQRLHCLNVHLNLFQRGRKRQLGLLERQIEEIIPDGEPYVLAGDFNDWSEKASLLIENVMGAQEIFRSTNGRHAATYPSKLPILRLDRMYVRGCTPSAARVLRGKPWSQLSDHAPIYGEVSLDDIAPFGRAGEE